MDKKNPKEQRNCRIPVVPDLSPPPSNLHWSLLLELRDGVMRTAVFYAALEFGIFTLLKNKKKGMTSAELAIKLHLNHQATEVLLDCITGLGLLHKDKKNGCYYNSREATWFLVEDSPYFIGLRPPGIGSEYPWESFLWSMKCAERWKDLLTNGEVNPKRILDLEACGIRCKINKSEISQNYFARNALRGHINETLGLLKEEEILNGAKTLLDLGGGHGLFGLAFAQAIPGLTVKIYELADIAKITHQFIEAYNIQNLIEVIEGDMLVDPIPGSYDIVFCSNLLFNMDDMHNLAKKILKILNPGGWVIWKLFFPPNDLSESLNIYLMFVYNFLQSNKVSAYKKPPVAIDVLHLMETIPFESARILGVVDNHTTICVARKSFNDAS